MGPASCPGDRVAAPRRLHHLRAGTLTAALAGLTYEDVRGLTELPASVAVVGGADTGCQLALDPGDDIKVVMGVRPAMTGDCEGDSGVVARGALGGLVSVA